MAINLPVEVIKRQEWLEPIAERLQTTVATALGPDGPVGSKRRSDRRLQPLRNRFQPFLPLDHFDR